MRSSKNTFISRFAALILALIVPFVAFQAPKTYALTLSGIALEGPVPTVTAGFLPKVKDIVSTVSQYQIGTTNWAYYNETTNSWQGFGHANAGAVADGTHYGLSFQIDIVDPSQNKFSNDVSLYLNNMSYKNKGYSDVLRINDECCHVFYDLGPALPETIDPNLPALQNVNLSGDILSWNALSGTDTYFLLVQNTTYGGVHGFTLKENSCDLLALLGFWSKDSTYSLDLFALTGTDDNAKRCSQSWKGSYSISQSTPIGVFELAGSGEIIKLDSSKGDQLDLSVTLSGKYAQYSDKAHYCWSYYYQGEHYFLPSFTNSISIDPKMYSHINCYLTIDGYYYMYTMDYTYYEEKPLLFGTIVISGDCYWGETLTVKNAGLNMAHPENLLYKWQVSDDGSSWSDIPGRDAFSKEPSFEIADGQEGKYLRVVAKEPDHFEGQLVSKSVYIAESKVIPVTFDMNGHGDPLYFYTRTYRYAQKIPDPIDPGYVFLYWSTDKEGKVEFDFSQRLLDMVYLYAIWTEDPNYEFDIKMNVGENGFAAPSATKSASKKTISVAATGAVGYDVDKIILKTEDGVTQDITALGEFTMPHCNVTVEVTFKVKSSSSDPSFEEFVERLYTVALDRPSEPEGKAFWVDQVVNKGFTGADCARFFMLGAPEFLNRNLTDDEFVEVLYKTYFNRESEPEGKAYWLGRLAEGTERAVLVEEFIESTEWCDVCAYYGVKSGALYHKATKPSKNALRFASRLYICCLGRAPEEDGLAYWALALTNLDATGYQAASLFFTSPEFIGLGLSDDVFVERLYRTFMGREPDEPGSAYWITFLRSGNFSGKDPRVETMKTFAGCPEFETICNAYGMIRGAIE